VRSKLGYVSNFEVSTAREGTPLTKKVQVLIKTLLSAIRVFHDEEDLCLGVQEDGTLLLWTKTRSLSFTDKAVR
jgi:hypothetical protein